MENPVKRDTDGPITSNSYYRKNGRQPKRPVWIYPELSTTLKRKRNVYKKWEDGHSIKK